MAFWNDYFVDPNGKGFEPKRKFTFLLSIAGTPLSGTPATIENYLIKKVKKPGFEATETKHAFLNHTFYYPGRIEWKEVSFTIVDVINPNTTQQFMQLLESSGYRAPQGPVSPGSQNAQTLSKLRSVAALGIPMIRQLDADGNLVDEWTLKGAWVKSVDNGELNYDEDDLMSIEVVLRYDYAFCSIKQPTNIRALPSNAS